MKQDIQIILAPSILGLKPSGVEFLPESLINAGLVDVLKPVRPVVDVPTQNVHYTFVRDRKTHCLNPAQIQKFSLILIDQISRQVQSKTFPIVLGGDCSILLGIMPALKREGEFGLIFLDAHADFYQPSKSITGEVADMDLAMVTGYGPNILTNIDGLKPYVRTRNVIHIGQRDAEEARRYGSRDIKDTLIKCFDLEIIRTNGINGVMTKVLTLINRANINGYWIHFDTDVLSDDENPAVDYRLPGGLSFKEVEYILHALLKTNRIAGMSVTIFNPTLDTSGTVAKKITNCLSNALASAP